MSDEKKIRRPKPRPLVTTPALKYDVTEIYGDCEHDGCEQQARVTCSICATEVCRNHAEHDTHAKQ